VLIPQAAGVPVGGLIARRWSLVVGQQFVQDRRWCLCLLSLHVIS